MALVKFYRGTYDKYVKGTMSDGIYFAQDKQLIIMNGVEYGGVNMSQFEGFIKDVDVEGQTLSFKKDVDGTWEDISIQLLQAADSSIELGTITTGGVNDGSTIKVKTKTLGTNEDGLKLDTTNGLYVDFTQHDTKDNALQDAIDLLNDVDTKEGSVKKTVKDAIEALDVNDTLTAGSFVTKVTETDGKIAVSKAAITSSDKTITVTADTTNGALDLKANIDGTTILADKTTGKLSVASEALTQYVGKEAINVSAAVDGEKTISLVINANDKVLTQDANGLLTNLSFSYDEGNRLIKLTGKDNTEIGTVDAKAFIKDGMLAGETVFMAEGTTQTVTIKEQTHEFTGLTKGNHYIAFMFSTSDGETTTYSWDILDATKIIDVYSAGNGLELSDDKHTFSVKKDTVSKDSEEFLSISENGVKVSGVHEAINTAAAASKTEVKEKDGDAHIDVTSTTAADGHTIYTVASVDTASAKDLTDEIAARKAVDGQNGQTYAANATANYINAATSLNDADIKLDSALKAEADRAAAAEDKIEGSVGLAADGSHITTSGNYTSKATTVVGEISALDNQVKTNADAIKALEDAKVSVVKDEASEKFLEVTANDANTVYTVKVSGINDAITTAINGLDVTDAAVESQYVSSVTETDGKIKVSRTDLTAKVTKFTAITGDDTTVEVNATNVQDAVASIAKNVKTNETALTWIDVE
jgi:hypothetical protein